MSQNSPLLQIDHVQKSFPGVQALVDANLTIQSNEIHALVGQNGAGKSTLIKTSPEPIIVTAETYSLQAAASILKRHNKRSATGSVPSIKKLI